MVSHVVATLWTVLLNANFLREFLTDSVGGLSIVTKAIAPHAQSEHFQEHYLGLLNNIAFGGLSLAGLTLSLSDLSLIFDMTLSQPNAAFRANYGFAFLGKLASDSSLAISSFKHFQDHVFPKANLENFGQCLAIARTLSAFCNGCGLSPDSATFVIEAVSAALGALPQMARASANIADQFYCEVIDVAACLLKIPDFASLVPISDWLSSFDGARDRLATLIPKDAPCISFSLRLLKAMLDPQAQSPKTGLVLVEGSQFAKVLGATCRNDVEFFESVRLDSPVTSGMWYYEVELATDNVMQIGWMSSSASLSSTLGVGVGDERHSYSGTVFGGAVACGSLITNPSLVDLCRELTWHDGDSKPFEFRWAKGGILGCFIDLDTGTISITYNFALCGVAFEDAFAAEVSESMCISLL